MVEELEDGEERGSWRCWSGGDTESQEEDEVIDMGKGAKETRNKSVDHRSDNFLCL